MVFGKKNPATGKVKKVERDCEKCRQFPELREKWGCEDDTAKPPIVIPCPRCDGAGDVQGDDERKTCGRCGGQGQELIYRCPNATLPGSGVYEFFERFGWAESGLFTLGAADDQTVHFLQAIRYVNAWRSRLTEETKDG